MDIAVLRRRLPSRLRGLRRHRRVVLGLFGAFVLALSVIGLIRSCRRTGGSTAPMVLPSQRLDGVTVVLDPGHGGMDSGTRHGGAREDVINYRMTSVVAEVLTERGATVIYTVRSKALVTGLREGEPEPPMQRPSDATLCFNGDPVRMRADRDPADLYRRAAIAATAWQNLPEDQRRRGHGLYFLALHCDDLGNSSGRGARVYFDRRGGGPSRLATILQRRLTDAGLTNSRHGMVIPRQYGVLNPQYNPVPERALVEMLTLSNGKDRKAVLAPAWRWRLARLIADSIAECEAGGVR